MRALEFDGTRVAVRDVPRPEVDEASALVRVSLAGVCNTDIELVKGYMGFRGVLGHEFVGTVAEGPASLLGERVVGEINFACGVCSYCAIGLGRHCPTRDVMGILRADGAFAEFVRVPIANLHPVLGVPDELAVFTMLAAAFEILEQVRVAGRDASCRRRQSACGGAGAADGRRRRPRRGRHREARVLQAASRPSCLGRAQAGVAGGRGDRSAGLGAPRAASARTLVLRAPTPSEGVDLNPPDPQLHDRSRCGPFPPALRALETDAVDVRSLIHARLPLARADEALRMAAEPGMLKVLIEAD
jgi:threonine dehydrogenase-like Zn-dependent dehydrogenase